MTEPIKNIIVDGVAHPVDEFSAQIQSLVKVRQDWVTELDVLRGSVLKNEMAINKLDVELSNLVAKELAERNKTE